MRWGIPETPGHSHLTLPLLRNGPSLSPQMGGEGFCYRRSSIASALETPYSPDGSTLSSLTTPSFTTIE